jgi:CheY-like chemotaxis protein
MTSASSCAGESVAGGSRFNIERTAPNRSAPAPHISASELLRIGWASHWAQSDELGRASAAAILIIEDDPLVRQFVELVLSQAGYTISSVATGDLGLRALQQSKWDLVLLDIQLPDMTGVALLRLLRRYQRIKATVMMMTAKGDLATVREAMDAGANGYLVKPFTPDALTKRVEAMLAPKPKVEAPADLKFRDLEVD